eukprot:TRINITY_DN18566_c0_g1_i2.p1 TRINITY_DN18566_c0_g1~~TRINITY_DN18566_c0_g1_i2.p1  ORF type:complete len:339 (+),score=107.57 TRINITY_DN18566_c0_g1_i2:340-1356(+)
MGEGCGSVTARGRTRDLLYAFDTSVIALVCMTLALGAVLIDTHRDDILSDSIFTGADAGPARDNATPDPAARVPRTPQELGDQPARGWFPEWVRAEYADCALPALAAFCAFLALASARITVLATLDIGDGALLATKHPRRRLLLMQERMCDRWRRNGQAAGEHWGRLSKEERAAAVRAAVDATHKVLQWTHIGFLKTLCPEIYAVADGSDGLRLLAGRLGAASAADEALGWVMENASSLSHCVIRIGSGASTKTLRMKTVLQNGHEASRLQCMQCFATVRAAYLYGVVDSLTVAEHAAALERSRRMASEQQEGGKGGPTKKKKMPASLRKLMSKVASG